MKTTEFKIIVLIALFSISLISFAESAKQVPCRKDNTPAHMQWWRQAKFGIFFCWGPSSLTGDVDEMGWGRMGAHPFGRKGSIPIEIYDNLYKRWQPEKFDAEKWVQFVIDSGAKYMIFLVKHHDGFCLYDTKLTDYKSTSLHSAIRKDYLAKITQACHKLGLKLFVYYSQPDWHHPDYRTENHNRYIEYLHGQVREILTGYGRIDGIWFDGLEAKPQDWDAVKLLDMARQLQPHIIINDRAGLPADFATAENRVGKARNDRPWESCAKLGTRWIWKSADDELKSLQDCIKMLVRTVGGDGNFALNTGPRPDGTIDPAQKRRFKEIGTWLEKYGRSIYGTRGGPFVPAAWGASTYSDNIIYIHILNWRGPTLRLPKIDKQIVDSKLLTGGSVTVRKDDDYIEFDVPPKYRHKIDTIVELKLDGPAAEVPAVIHAPGIYSMKATASSVNSRMLRDEPAWAPYKAFDDSCGAHSYWKPDDNVNSAWLELDMLEKTSFKRVMIKEAFASKIKSFELLIKDENNRWTEIVAVNGVNIGDQIELNFNPVSTRYVRLNISESDGSPAIYEFQLYKE